MQVALSVSEVCLAQGVVIVLVTLHHTEHAEDEVVWFTVLMQPKRRFSTRVSEFIRHIIKIDIHIFGARSPKETCGVCYGIWRENSSSWGSTNGWSDANSGGASSEPVARVQTACNGRFTWLWTDHLPWRFGPFRLPKCTILTDPDCPLKVDP